MALAQTLGDRLAEGFARVYLGGVEEARGRYADAADYYVAAPTVIASLWTEDDLATRDLMLAFYSRLEAGMGKAAALQTAQAEIRQRYPSPYYWAAFVLNGDPGHGTANVDVTRPVDAAPEPDAAAPATTRGGQGTPPPPPPPPAPSASLGWLDAVVQRIGARLR